MPSEKTGGVLRWMNAPSRPVWLGSRWTLALMNPEPSSPGMLWQELQLCELGPVDREGEVAGPLARVVEIGAGNAREALAVADVSAHAIDGVEDGLEEFVPVLEGFLERLGAVARADKLGELALVELIKRFLREGEGPEELRAGGRREQGREEGSDEESAKDSGDATGHGVLLSWAVAWCKPPSARARDIALLKRARLGGLRGDCDRSKIGMQYGTGTAQPRGTAQPIRSFPPM